jgi:hypothetical protein
MLVRALVSFSGCVGRSGSVRKGDTFDVDAMHGVALTASGHAEPVDPEAACAEVAASGWSSPEADAFIERRGSALPRRSERFAREPEPTSLAGIVGHPTPGTPSRFSRIFGRG